MSSAALNLSGTWDLVKVEGDIGKFLAEQKVGWAFRKLASVIMKRGFDKTLVIEHDDNKLRIDEVGAPRNKKFKQSYSVEIGGGAVEWKNPKEDSTMRSWAWKDAKAKAVLVSHVQEEYPKQILQFMQDGLLVDEVRCIYQGGKTGEGFIRHVYKKRAP